MSDSKTSKEDLSPESTEAPRPAPQVVIEKAKEREAKFTVRAHVGPLPDPDTLRAYNEILPGSAERIVSSMEQTVRHFQECQTKQIDAEIEDRRVERDISKRGQSLGFTLVIFLVVTGSVAAFYGHETFGGILVGTTVVSLATVFVYGRHAALTWQQREKQVPERHE